MVGVSYTQQGDGGGEGGREYMVMTALVCSMCCVAMYYVCMGTI